MSVAFIHRHPFRCTTISGIGSANNGPSSASEWPSLAQGFYHIRSFRANSSMYILATGHFLQMGAKIRHRRRDEMGDVYEMMSGEGDRRADMLCRVRLKIAFKWHNGVSSIVEH